MSRHLEGIDPAALERQIALISPVVAHLRVATVPEISPAEWGGLAARAWRERSRELREALAVACASAEALLQRLRLVAGQLS